MRRHKLVHEILTHTREINANAPTVVFLLATMTDRALTKFHKEFMAKEKYTDENN